jgi:dTDP-glucose 4,6-dehydratase
VYHLATRVTHSIRQVVELICRRLAADFSQVIEVVGERPGKDAAYLLDSTKARTALGWEDRVGFEAGVGEVIAWVDEHLDTLRRQPLIITSRNA